MWLTFTGLSGGAPDCLVSQLRQCQRSSVRSERDTWLAPTVDWVHQTVYGAPTGPEEQRSAAPDMEGDRAPDMNSGCPVVHRTVRCTTRQKVEIAFQVGLQRLLAALGL
jgi:hypothetical protein